MFGNNGLNRPAGAGQPTHQRTGEGAQPQPRSLRVLTPAETFAVDWVDDDGAVHTELMHRINGEWYRAPNGENYAATLRKVNQKTWLGPLLEEKYRGLERPGSGEMKVPEQAVDVVGDQG